MATGDKLFIADKQTLDDTKQLAQDTNTTVNELKSSVIQLPNQVATSEYFTAGQISKLVHGAHTIINNSTPIINLQGSGLLYYSLALHTNSSYAITMKVIVDGVTILDGSAYTSGNNYKFSGIFSQPTILGLDANSQVRIAVPNNTSFHVDPGTISPLVANSTSSVCYSMKPIRWNESLVIRAYTNAAASSATLYTYYELD